MRHILPKLFPRPEPCLTKEGRNVEHAKQFGGNLEAISVLNGINSRFAYLWYSRLEPQLTVAATMILPHPDR